MPPCECALHSHGPVMNPPEEPPPEAVAQFVHSLAAHLVQQASAELEKVLLMAEVDSRPLPHPLPVEYVPQPPWLSPGIAGMADHSIWVVFTSTPLHGHTSCCSSLHESSLGFGIWWGLLRALDSL